MDKCFYCGNEYHPMPVWTRKAGVPTTDNKPNKIRVCRYRFTTTDDDFKIDEVDECSQKATADGYEFRRDLTPRR